MKNNTQIEQELYIKKYKLENRIVKASRISLLFLFLLFWELMSDLSVIDSFFFSSPSRITLLFIDMCI